MHSVSNDQRADHCLVAVRSRKGAVTWHAIFNADVAVRGGVKRHSLDSLNRARSLEGLLDKFGIGEIVFDPTGGFERSLRIVNATKAARAKLGSRLRSVHLKAGGRALHARIASADDATYVAATLGDCFAKALDGASLEITVAVSTKPAPAGSLAIERLVARQEDIARVTARVSAATAVLGAAFVGAHATTARANTPQSFAATREVEAPQTDLPKQIVGRPEFILTDGVEQPRRQRPPRRTAPRPRVEAPLPPAAPSCPVGEPSPAMTSIVRAVYDRNGVLIALHLDNRDRGLATEDFNQKAFSLVRSLPMGAIDAAGQGAQLDGVRVLASQRLRTRAAAGATFVLTMGQCAAPTPVVIAPPVPPPAPPLAPPPAPAPISRSYLDVGADYINRDVQEGGVVVAHGQLDLPNDFALNGQAAAGQIDGEFAGGAQLALQRFAKLAKDDQIALGAFISSVTSIDPNDDRFDIERVGLGAAWMNDTIQLVIRGGYARTDGFGDLEGGFGRGEATWFVTPDLALDLAIEDDPITGQGVGVGTAFRPFTELFPQLMIDADANWHQDGEDSFRVGLRWMLGAQENRTVRERRARQGMAPTLQVELERLPETSKSGPNSYCGEAGECPAA